MIRRIILAPIVLPVVLILTVLNLIVITVSSVYENVAGIPMKLLGILVLLALITKTWLAAALFAGILAAGYLVIIFAGTLALLLELGRDSLLGLLLA